MFTEELEELDGGLKVMEEGGEEIARERLGDADALRSIWTKLVDDDETSSWNRKLVQEQMDFVPPLDQEELEAQGQGDRFNLNTGLGAAIKNETVSSFMDIFTTPRVLAEIPLKDTIDSSVRGTWSQVIAEEFTALIRNDPTSLPRFLQLADIYSTHGVGIGYFEDRQSYKYGVTGLDDMKFPRKSGIVWEENELAACSRLMSVTELYDKIEPDAVEGWDREAVMDAVVSTARKHNPAWDRWEEIQKQVKSNDLYMDTVCPKIELIYAYVREFDGTYSFYICTADGDEREMKRKDKKNFLFRGRGFFKNADECLHIFPFSVGNSGRLYTVRGIGYVAYFMANAMDIMYSKLFDNARSQSSLIFQPRDVEAAEDMTLVDIGPGLAVPPNVEVAQRPPAANLNQTLMPALDAGSRILDRATGGLASGGLMLEKSSDRKTNLEISSKLDYISKLGSFAISLFYGPYDKVIREQVKRVFTKRQSDKRSREQVKLMMERIKARGVPEEALKEIDYMRVRAFRIVGTGSRASRIMLYDQIQQLYSTFDDEGKENFSYDFLVELIGAERANRYKSMPGEKKEPYDAAIAELENLELLEGDYLEPISGENRMVHLKKHLERLEAGLVGVEDGQVDIGEYAMENIQLWKHAINTMEVTTVHESIMDEYNGIRQRLQQIGEIITNGMRKAEKMAREQQEARQQQEGGGEVDEKQIEMQRKQAEHQQKLQQDLETHMVKLKMMAEQNQAKIAIEQQKAMSQIAMKDAEVAAKINQAKIRAMAGSGA